MNRNNKILIKNHTQLNELFKTYFKTYLMFEIQSKIICKLKTLQKK